MIGIKTSKQEVTYTDPDFNNKSEEQILNEQEKLLKKQLKYVYRNSEYYRKRFDEIDIKPEEIKTLEEYYNLPVFMNKELERESQRESQERFGHPFGMHLCTSPDDIAFTGTTSGTSGNPTFTYTFTQQDLNFLNRYIAHMLEYGGIHAGERVLFSHSLGIYATSSILWGLREHGVLPIDVDVRAGSNMILKYAQMTNPSAIMTTPSLAEYLINKSSENGINVADFGLQAIFTVGEIGIGIPEIKKKIEGAYNCRVYDYLGELGFSCDSDEYHGIHCVAPDFNLFPNNLIDPETKKPIEIYDGVIGELIDTELNIQALPRIRYSSGDIVQVFTKECPGCGFKGKRVRFVGRSDDMLIIKGANVYPSVIKKVIANFTPYVTGELRIVLNSPPPRVVPPLEIKLEYGEKTSTDDLGQLEEKIKRAMHTEARLTPKIIWCTPGELGKEMTKTPLFEKNY
ncbi:phenylacetate--CoA ligase family protein [Virgibacillus ainsalahensis]